jgi:hypothetical protein
MSKKIEEVQMTKDELSSLPEYSCTLPAMTTIGNKWKRNTTFDSVSYSPDGPWVLGEYVAASKNSLNKVAIFWRKIVLIENEATIEDGIFEHECVKPQCMRRVEFDDEPWCFAHSPDEGSSLPGYSARKSFERHSKEVEPYKVIEILVNELDKHGHGDLHYNAPDYRDPNVMIALIVGRTWLDAHHKEQENDETNV